MGKDFTNAQLSAIKDRGNNLLVSAAAGSGKTTVLIERIIRRLTDPCDSINIDDLLVVTFTKSAAAEIREKLSAALSQKVAENPTDRKLIRQLAMLGNAHINTIDAFFLDVIKENSEKLGLPSNVSPCDEATSDTLMEKACDEVLEELYASEKEGSPFYELIENFSDMRSDGNVSEVLIKLYKDLRNLPKPFEYLKSAISDYDFVASGSEYMESVWGKKLAKAMSELSLGMIMSCDNVLDVIAGDDGLSGRYNAAIENIKNFYISLDTAVRSGKYENVRNVVKNYSGADFTKANKPDEIAKKYVKKFRENAEKEIKEKLTLLFSQTADEIKEIAGKSSELLDTAYSILEKFDAVYSAKKKALGVIDFADMPKNCFELLSDENFAKNAVGNFKELYIDEYQDTNELRDTIFEMVANASGATRFMVGDVKQCIYAFINSDPKLFMKYYDEYEDGKKGKRIILSENFRSDLPVVNTVNTVFSSLMTKECGGVNYDDNAALVHKKKDTEGENSELIIIAADDKPKKDELNKLQVKMIANKISELVSSGKYKQSEIAILTRKNEEIPQYMEALAKAGIKASSGKQSFFELPEIKILLSVLSAVDNPNSDVPLFSAMCGPIFGFSFGEVSLLALEKSGSLWDSVIEHSENDGKLKAFVEKLNAYRSYSLSYPLDKLIVKISKESGFERAIRSKPDGRSRYEAVLKLCRFAREYSTEDYRGIGNFLTYMQRLEKIGKTDKEAGSADGVTVCTVHNSKGLEYEVCFAVGLERDLKGNNTAKSLHITNGFPPAFVLKHPTGFATVNSPMLRATVYFEDSDPLSEEMRILYVELTRAKKKLYMSAAIDAEKLSEMTEMYKFEKNICSPLSVSRSKTCFEWIMRSLCNRFSVQNIDSAIYGNAELCDHLKISLVKAEEIGEAEAVSADISADGAVEIDAEYVYRSSDRTGIPAKLSVSELSDDENAEPYFAKNEALASPSPIRPLLMAETSASPAEKGIAMHQFMQFCDFALAENDIGKEADRLVQNGFITEKQRKLIDEKLLSDFFATELYDRIKKSKVYREFRYNLCEDSSEYYTVNGEKVLVQGVIDCFFEEADGSITLLDFKTDRVPEKDGGEILKKRYSPQLSFYRKAVEKILEKKVSHTYIYSFALSCEIEI